MIHGRPPYIARGHPTRITRHANSYQSRFHLTALGDDAGAQVQADFGCPVVAIITMADIIQYLTTKPEHAASLQAMQAYRAQYGALSE